jgi:hypothetical protein
MAPGRLAVLCLALAALAISPCLAQDDGTTDDVPELFSAETLSHMALYVGVTIVIVAVFTLVFLKCWNETSRALEEQEAVEEADPAADASGEGSP